MCLNFEDPHMGMWVNIIGSLMLCYCVLPVRQLISKSSHPRHISYSAIGHKTKRGLMDLRLPHYA